MRPHAEDPHDSLVGNTAFFELSLDDLINEAMLTIDAPRIHTLQAANQRLDEALVILNDALNDHFRWMIERQCDMLAKSRLIGVQFDVLLEDGFSPSFLYSRCITIII